MKRRNIDLSPPLRDYSDALRTAVSWLGERYLLAVPVTPRPRSRPHPALYQQSHPWLPPDRTRS
jgi:hypothetical protein